MTLTAFFTTLIMAYSWMRFLWRTERGRDIRKLRTLAEQAPMLNNICMLIVSLAYYILFALLDINTVVRLPPPPVPALAEIPSGPANGHTGLLRLLLFYSCR